MIHIFVGVLGKKWSKTWQLSPVSLFSPSLFALPLYLLRGLWRHFIIWFSRCTFAIYVYVSLLECERFYRYQKQMNVVDSLVRSRQRRRSRESCSCARAPGENHRLGSGDTSRRHPSRGLVVEFWCRQLVLDGVLG